MHFSGAWTHGEHDECLVQSGSEDAALSMDTKLDLKHPLATTSHLQCFSWLHTSGSMMGVHAMHWPKSTFKYMGLPSVFMQGE